MGAKGKIALVTGASAGIGKQTARELNLRGATVYMLCRDRIRSQSARIELTKVREFLKLNFMKLRKDHARLCPSALQPNY